METAHTFLQIPQFVRYRCPSISRTTISRTLDNPDDFRATDPAYSSEIALVNPDSQKAGRILGNQAVRLIEGHLYHRVKIQ